MTNSDQKCLVYTVEYATTLFVLFTISLFQLPVNPFTLDSMFHYIFTTFQITGWAPAGFSVWLFPGKSLKGGSAGSWCAADQRTGASAAYRAADEWGLSRVFIRKRSESPRYPVRREAAHLEPAPERRDLSGKSHTEKLGGARPSSYPLPYDKENIRKIIHHSYKLTASAVHLLPF